MILAMILAHLLGDYILQWDSLAAWKSQEFKGVLVHGAIITAVTGFMVYLYDPTWWQGVLFISLAHIMVDAIPLLVKTPIPPLVRFIVDQILHFTIIIGALIAGGYMDSSTIVESLLFALQNDRSLGFLLGYTFITMPAWVLVKFVAYGFVKGTTPNFPGGKNKYIGIFERILITTFVLFGQFLLIPFITLPGLLADWPRVTRSDRVPVYLVEYLGSIILALATGLGLSLLS